jgi:hypothetical protein
MMELWGECREEEEEEEDVEVGTEKLFIWRALGVCNHGGS